MWILTYVGALFNGLTLLILGKSVLQPLGLTEPSSGSICWWHEVIVLWCLHWLLIKWKVKCSIFVVVVQVWLQFSAARSFMRNTRWVFVNFPVHMSQLKLYSKGVCVCLCVFRLRLIITWLWSTTKWKISLESKFKKKISKQFNWIYSHESRSDGFSDFLQDPGESPGHET